MERPIPHLAGSPALRALLFAALTLLFVACGESDPPADAPADRPAAREEPQQPDPAPEGDSLLDASDASPSPVAPPSSTSPPNRAASDAPAHPPSEAPSRPSPAGRELDDTFEGTTGRIEKPGSAMEPPILRDVRYARHAHYDRVVFEFGGGLPGYQISYVEPPLHACGSGHLRHVSGRGKLEVHLEPAFAHTEAGRVTVVDRELESELPSVREIEQVCDFEAVVTWMLGIAERRPYRVLELERPARLVIDVKHE